MTFHNHFSNCRNLSFIEKLLDISNNSHIYRISSNLFLKEVNLAPRVTKTILTKKVVI